MIRDLSASGQHNARLLGMLRSSGLIEYPKDDSEVSLEGHEAVPVVFSEVYKAWRRVD